MTSLASQWLRFWVSTAGSKGPSLVGKLRSHMPCSMAKKKKKNQKCKSMSTALESVSTAFRSPPSWLLQGLPLWTSALQSLLGMLCVCPEGGLAVPSETQLQALEGSSSSVAFLQWIHFLDAKHLYLLVLPFEWCLWLVCFELHYRLECNCGEKIFILPRVAANHSYMLQRVCNGMVLYVCVFNCSWEVLWRRICMTFKICDNFACTFHSISATLKMIFSLNFSALTSLYIFAVGHDSFLLLRLFCKWISLSYCLRVIFLGIICRQKTWELFFWGVAPHKFSHTSYVK